MEDLNIPTDTLFWRGHNITSVLSDYYRAHILLGYTPNAFATAHMTNKPNSPSAINLVAQQKEMSNATYVIFQGSLSVKDRVTKAEPHSDIEHNATVSEATTITSTTITATPSFNDHKYCSIPEIILTQQLRYLSFLALSCRIEEDNTTRAATCEVMIKELSSGLLKFPTSLTLVQLNKEVAKRAEESLLPQFMQRQRAQNRARRVVVKDTLM